MLNAEARAAIPAKDAAGLLIHDNASTNARGSQQR
jgi:hypothetical protein